jgi:hypothetical protein
MCGTSGDWAASALGLSSPPRIRAWRDAESDRRPAPGHNRSGVFGGQLVLVEIGLSCRTGYRQLGEHGEHLADLAGVIVESSSLASERSKALVIVLDDDFIDEAVHRLPYARRSPSSTGRFRRLEFVDQLGELPAHAKAQHKAQLMPVHADLL